MLFLRLDNYFDAAAPEKPLLHTWSLGLEEQFYVGWSVF
jgi:peptidoglycan/LPS O-acetylase OafA/YrhL